MADTGYGFDFAARLDTSPDSIGSSAAVGRSRSAGGEPFALANGDARFRRARGSVHGDAAGPELRQHRQRRRRRIAAARNADANFQANGMVASVVAGQLA
jgi:hypothetical protein